MDANTWLTEAVIQSKGVARMQPEDKQLIDPLYLRLVRVNLE